MADLPGYMRACLHTGKLACLAILVSGGIVLQILACALYNNWWPMLTVLMYVLLPMPLLFFAGSNGSSLCSESDSGLVLPLLRSLNNQNLIVSPRLSMKVIILIKFHLTECLNGWVNATKFLTGASAVGSIAIPAILKHAGVIGWGAMAMELSSFFIFVLAIMCYIRMSDDNNYSML